MTDTNRAAIERFFSGLTEHTFEVRLGVVDPPLVDYVSQLLVRFVHTDSIYKVRQPNGRRLYEVAEMLLEAELRQGDSKRAVHRHIGDFTLFWAGLFPETVEHRRRQARLDALLDYRREGKRAYFIASTIPSEEPEENDLLSRLSAQFDLCCYALGELRKEWEHREGPNDSEGPVLLG